MPTSPAELRENWHLDLAAVLSPGLGILEDLRARLDLAPLALLEMEACLKIYR